MYNLKLALLLIITAISVNYSSAQLSGYYTIGGDTADYTTLAIAIDDLTDLGIEGPVTFGLNPGTYPGVSITTITGTAPDSYFILESVTHDSTDVIIQGTISLNQTSFVKIKHLSVITGNTRTFNIFKSRFLYIENCIIESDYDDGGDDDAAVYITHYFNNETYFSSVTFQFCSFDSPAPNLVSRGQKGTTSCFDSEFTTDDGDYCIYARNNHKFKINNVILNGGFKIEVHAYSYIKNSQITGQVYSGKFDSIVNTTIISDDVIRLTSDYFENCHFEGIQFTDSNMGTNGSSTFINNYFDCPFRVGRATFPKVIRNTFLDGVRFSFNDALLFEENTVYGQFSYGEVTTSNWNYRIYNNVFSNGLVLADGYHSVFSYNSFIDGATLWIGVHSIEVYDNNFCCDLEGFPGELIAHNNFYPLTYCQFDTAATNYDPVYSESHIGIATNPLLQGKGLYQAPEFDYLGAERKNPPAIGANEVFMCSDSLNNEITVPCGEEVYLNICSLPETGDFWWEPSECVEYPDSAYTMVNACEDNMTLYLYHSEFGLIDSVIIHTEDFSVEIAEMPVFYCDYPRRITASYHPKATYHWTPEYGLSDPYSRTPILNVDNTDYLEYIIECEIEGCGISYDSLFIDFDSIPYPQLYYPEQIHDTVFFNCVSRCTDEYLWDFGDGSTSTDKEAFHIYQENGTYTITLTVFNEYGSRSGSLDYQYYWLKENHEKIVSQNIQVFPNPADNMLTIKGLNLKQSTMIHIFDISGDLDYTSPVLNDEMLINTQKFKQGMHFVHIRSQEINIIMKILIVH